MSPRTFFLPLRPRFSTIIYKFAHIFSGVTPWRVSPGAVRPPPPSDATGPNPGRSEARDFKVDGIPAKILFAEICTLLQQRVQLLQQNFNKCVWYVVNFYYFDKRQWNESFVE